jgi:HSP20 family protein
MKASTRWNLFKDSADVESLFAPLHGPPLDRGGNGGAEQIIPTEWIPAVDITEGEQEWRLTVDLPEVKKPDVKITVENGVLSVTGERRIEPEGKNRKYHRSERAYGHFMRRFALPAEVDLTLMTAEFKEGVLSIHLPKHKKAQPLDVKLA